MTINEQIIQELMKDGLNSINSAYYSKIDYWKDWYKGLVSDFHLYNVKLADGTTVLCLNFCGQIKYKLI